MKKLNILLFALVTMIATAPAFAENYTIDTKGQHAFIQFKVKHLGYSWILGGFNKFSGKFSYDEKKPSSNNISITIQTDSIDTNHAKRDKHLRSPDFFDAANYPEITFISTSYQDIDDKKAQLKGKLTLHGVTKTVTIDVEKIGAGNDPWGNYRRGFSGTTTLHMSDYKFKKGAMLGPVAENIELFFSFEGIRDKKRNLR